MPPRRLEPLRATLLVGTLTAAVGVGFVWGRQAKSQPAVAVERATAPACPPPSLAAIVPIADVGALRQEIREVLRQELRQFLAEGAHSAQPDPVAAVSPAQTEAHQRALALLDTASGRRHWSNDDARALRQLMPAMTGEQRQEVLHRLLPAINGGELVSDAQPPF